MNREKCGAPAYANVEKGRTCNNYADTCPKHKGWRDAKPTEARVIYAPSSTVVDPVRPEPNTVHHPAHYNAGSIEVIEAIEAWNLGFNLGNVVKYVVRADHKGSAVEDLRKALWYIQRELDRRNTVSR